MKRKRKHAEVEQSEQVEDEQLQTEPTLDVAEENTVDNEAQEEIQQAVEDEPEAKHEEEVQPVKQHRKHKKHHNNNQHQHQNQQQQHQKQNDFETGQELEHSNFNNNHQQRKFRNPVYSRVSVDPTRTYRTPDSRESWGPNVKGKKFRKEKGKKKRCPNAGVRIDGSVKSVRLDV